MSGVLDWFRENRRVWQARRAPVVLVSAAAPGACAKLEGRVVLGDRAMPSPFTGTRAAIWRAQITQRHTTSGDSGNFGSAVRTYWRIEVDEAYVSPFAIVDDEGTRIDVVVERPILAMVLGDESNHPLVNGGGPEIDVYLRKQGISPTRFIGMTGEYVFRESRLVEGQFVTVFGKIVETEGVEPTTYRSEPTRTKRLVGTSDDRAVIADSVRTT